MNTSYSVTPQNMQWKVGNPYSGETLADQRMLTQMVDPVAHKLELLSLLVLI
jgi:hypothetical protein